MTTTGFTTPAGKKRERHSKLMDQVKTEPWKIETIYCKKKKRQICLLIVCPRLVRSETQPRKSDREYVIKIIDTRGHKVSHSGSHTYVLWKDQPASQSVSRLYARNVREFERSCICVYFSWVAFCVIFSHHILLCIRTYTRSIKIKSTTAFSLSRVFRSNETKSWSGLEWKKNIKKNVILVPPSLEKKNDDDYLLLLIYYAVFLLIFVLYQLKLLHKSMWYHFPISYMWWCIFQWNKKKFFNQNPINIQSNQVH